MSGPLTGVTVVEAGGIGPGPFAAMLLADMGAEVLRVEPPRLVTEADPSRPGDDLLMRGRRSVAIDLKEAAGLELFLELVDGADVLIEGFRPGVAERLGFGPDVCAARVPRLVYGRITGWGRNGPLVSSAGHDINYIALAGVLAHIGRGGERPVPPLNLLGDFGGGGMSLAFGIVCALFERSLSGGGQVVDASMVDGAALLTTMMHGQRARGEWSNILGRNGVDGGAPYYDVYTTADGRHVAIGSFEHRFFHELAHRIGLTLLPEEDHLNPSSWPRLRQELTAIFRRKTREDWCRELEGTDVCFAPVLTLDEAPDHPQNKESGTYIDVAGVVQPAPAPRLSRTPGRVRRSPPRPGQDTKDVLLDWGFSPARVQRLHDQGVVAW